MTPGWDCAQLLYCSASIAHWEQVGWPVGCYRRDSRNLFAPRLFDLAELMVSVSPGADGRFLADTRLQPSFCLGILPQATGCSFSSSSSWNHL